MGEFDAEIYDIVRQIPPGRVVTYGQLARLAQRSPLGAAGGTGAGECSRRIALSPRREQQRKACARMAGSAGVVGARGRDVSPQRLCRSFETPVGGNRTDCMSRAAGRGKSFFVTIHSCSVSYISASRTVPAADENSECSLKISITNPPLSRSLRQGRIFSIGGGIRPEVRPSPLFQRPRSRVCRR